MTRDWLNNLIESLRNRPHEWKICPHYAKHSSGLTMWIASGIFFLRVEEPFDLKIPLLWSFAVMRAIRFSKEKRANELVWKEQFKDRTRA